MVDKTRPHAVDYCPECSGAVVSPLVADTDIRMPWRPEPPWCLCFIFKSEDPYSVFDDPMQLYC